jgi:hypothetical protein
MLGNDGSLRASDLHWVQTVFSIPLENCAGYIDFISTLLPLECCWNGSPCFIHLQLLRIFLVDCGITKRGRPPRKNIMIQRLNILERSLDISWSNNRRTWCMNLLLYRQWQPRRPREMIGHILCERWTGRFDRLGIRSDRGRVNI